MNHRPRLLQIGTSPAAMSQIVAHADVSVANGPGDAAEKLRTGRYDGVIVSDTLSSELIERYCRDEIILSNIDQGIASLDLTGRVTWANVVLRGWCSENPVGQPLISSLNGPSASGNPIVLASDYPDPVQAAASGRAVSFRIHRLEPAAQSYLDVRIRPVFSGNGTVIQLVSLLQNVTAEVEQQRKLHALYTSGRELAALEPDLLAEMNVPTRIELLKKNIRKHVHDLLRYETIEVRLLDKQTGELVPLLEDGMTEQAANRRLYARAEGNGVTGHVAYTGDSYLCPDTTNDPYYLEGAKDARSSLTAPLKYADEVVGTLNVESHTTNAFGPEDLQFTELFSKEIASALNTLDLLTAQQSCTLSESMEAVNKELALPVDDVLANAALLYARLHANDADAAKHLRRIMQSARQMKECVHKIGRDMIVGTGSVGDAIPLIGKRVLVIEQDGQFRKQAHLMLGRLGAEVETVGTAAEALALVNDASYDAVLQEIRPIDMSGYDAFRRIRVAMPTCRVAFTTGFGYDAQHSIVKARMDGLQHVIFKPFRAEQVVGAVTAPPPPEPTAQPISAIN
ncbi:response regulator [Limnoglobus roseus]|uniref:Sensor kinase n=1 Tax=Limnoglobus roseus TaxID=2598579 RepID=A0A5C1AJ82_9BACT|nr:response regulator [Limnoglobus roseus]QEL18227.1 sensor kinase [Limnoglobus roseus]